MEFLIVFVLIIGLAGVIGNQYSALQRMRQMQSTLDEINRKLEAKD